MKDRPLAERVAERISKKSIDLTSLSGNSVSITQLKDLLRRSFQRKLGITLDVSLPAEEELADTRRLIDERYGVKGWILYNEKRACV